MPKLTTKSVLKLTDIRGIIEEFHTGKWGIKNLVGDVQGLRTPCIKLNDPDYRHRGLFGYQAIWVLCCGPVPDGKEISHLCATERKPRTGDNSSDDDDDEEEKKKRPVSACINILHMRLQTKADNSKRIKPQSALVKYKQSKQFSKESLKGPVFIKDNGDICKEADDTMEEASFINCGLIRRVIGFYAYEVTLRLSRSLQRVGVSNVHETEEEEEEEEEKE